MVHVCETCKKEFDTHESLQQHKQATHPEPEKPKPIPFKKIAIYGLILLIVFGAGFGLYKLATSPNSNSVAPTIDGIECNTMEQAVFHIHSHLEVYVDGEKVLVPANIGIVGSEKCLYWLHTHDSTGVIHIEAPLQRTFTLSNFFDIWAGTKNGTDLPPDGNVTVYVNGDLYDSSYRDIALENHKDITVEFGQPLVKPKIFAWDLNRYP